MATKKSSGLKGPVRPAPAPPPGRPSVLPVSKPMTNLMDSWDLSFDDPFGDAFSKQGSNQSSVWPDMHNTKKKVPPPRPPPPKITASTAGKSSSKHISSKQQPSRPSELLSSLFSRRGTKGESIPPHGSTGLCNRSAMPALPPVSSAVATASLIDLSSPPSSPTPTTRSSSDGLSVDSFGSDGTASHSHHHSQVESGFEDDSELFGGFTATPSPVNRDPWASSPSAIGDVFSPVNAVVTSSRSPWGSAPQDPFSPPRKFNSSPTPAPVPSPTPSVPASVPPPGVVAFKPTIIRPKVKASSSPSVTRAKLASSPMPSENESGDDRSESPPMPSIPPPAPPAELLSEYENSLPSGMESLSVEGNKIQGPHCIALYDYKGSHPDDLHFKEGDFIELVKALSGDWLQGRIQGWEGMFPSNFVKIVVPLSDAGEVFATALYTFTPETWEDLYLQEGAKVRLLSRVNNDWLYGECNGKRGQFPATFVDNVPSNLPIHS